MWSNAARTSPPLPVLFNEFFLVGDRSEPEGGGVAFLVSIGARGAVVVDLRPADPREILIDLVTLVRLRPAFDAVCGLVNVLALPEA